MTSPFGSLVASPICRDIHKQAETYGSSHVPRAVLDCLFLKFLYSSGEFGVTRISIVEMRLEDPHFSFACGRSRTSTNSQPCAFMGLRV